MITRSAVLIGVVVTACDPAAPADKAACEIAEIAIVTSPAVVLDWEPSCLVEYLYVFDHAGQTVWAITGSIEPPVTYGTPPAGIQGQYGPVDLVPGQRYRVQIGIPEPQGLRVYEKHFDMP